MWAQEVISEGRRLLEAAHGQATEGVLQSFRSTADALRQDAERFSNELLKQGTENAVSLQETASNLAKTNHEALEQATAKANQENRANTDEVISAVDRRWSSFTKSVIGAAIISSAVAVALTAVLVALT